MGAVSRLLIACLAMLAVSGTAEAARRIALVIGNDSYENLPVLKKAVADAKSYAELLRDQGFDAVTLHTDLNTFAANDAIAEFIAGIAPGDTAVFAFSGHGWSDGSQNFLIGTDAPHTGSPERLARISIPLKNGANGVLDDMDRRGAALKVAIIDACRDNPFAGASGTRAAGLSRGLSRIEPPSGTFVVFSAGTGQTALDRLSDADPDPNSVFTRIFVPLLRAGLTLQEATKQAQEQVTDLAGTVPHDQQPAYYDEVRGSACLASECARAAAPATASRPDDAAAAYQAALAVNSVEAWDAFLKYHPDGFYADLARSARKKLEPEVAALPVDPSPPPADEPPAARPDLVTECDRLAAIPLDPDKPTTLKAAGDPIPQAAVTACREAIAEHPDVRRFKTQLVHALMMLKQDLSEARAMAERAAAAGHVPAMLMLAEIYDRGLGGPERKEDVRDLVTRAAEGGLPLAIFVLANSYDNGGLGFEVDKEKAQGLWQELRSKLEAAATAGDPDAYSVLAQVYRDGLGVPADPVRAGDYMLEGLKGQSWLAIDTVRRHSADFTADQRKTAEQILSDKGHSPGPIDGIIDDATVAALDAWEKAVDLAGQ